MLVIEIRVRKLKNQIASNAHLSVGSYFVYLRNHHIYKYICFFSKMYKPPF